MKGNITDKTAFENGTKISSNIDESKREEVYKGTSNSCEQSTHKTRVKIPKKTKHEGVKYSCNLCEYKATRSDDLNRHQDSKHAEEARYTCNQCEFRTTQPKYLERHQELKHEEGNEGKRFSCKQCEYQTHRLDFLKRHQAKPNNHGKFMLKKSKPNQFLQVVVYSCNECEYKTKEEPKLKKHHQVKHEDILYISNQCEYRTEHKTELSTHKQLKHI